MIMLLAFLSVVLMDADAASCLCRAGEDPLCDAPISECVSAFDPFCKMTWDSQCVSEAKQRCDMDCEFCDALREDQARKQVLRDFVADFERVKLTQGVQREDSLENFLSKYFISSGYYQGGSAKNLVKELMSHGRVLSVSAAPALVAAPPPFGQRGDEWGG